MSKVDAQRAFREANYARRNTGGRPVPAPPTANLPQAAATTVPASPAIADDQSSPAAALCGHRGMGNRGCSRPAGHPEKNHRYK